jgi:uncharacterized protein YjiS (DUF1127 family)
VMAEHRQDLPIGGEASLRGLGFASARQAKRVFAVLLQWQDVSRQRRALLGLDDRMLRDIGISRADAEREAGRPFWDDSAERWRDWR